MRSLVVSMSDKDVAAGVETDCQRCPIALALGRTLWKLFGFQVPVHVGPTTIGFAIGEDWFHAITPKTARQFMVAFDTGWPHSAPMPLTFVFDEFPQHMVA